MLLFEYMYMCVCVYLLMHSIFLCTKKTVEMLYISLHTTNDVTSS